MPRYYRRRYTKVVRPKKKWASNMRELSMTINGGDIGVLNAGAALTLCENSQEVIGNVVVAPTPTIIKTGNFKVQVDVTVTTLAGAVVNVIAYILYLPDGMFVGSDPANPMQDYNALREIIRKHPEWIMGWRQLGFDEVAPNANLERVTFSSRLKRNLNSGDKVCFVLLANQSASRIARVFCNGMCQFWTCNN